ncbi:MAG: pimeloyl-ACP methyl ester carboxylesterase [Myxococcota bacterium]|jgi:pimeloyl-ACP methyl ester carboxylesterase
MPAHSIPPLPNGRKPFARGRFEDLPAVPTRSHTFHQTEARTVTVDAPGWPRLDTHVRVYGSGPPLLLIHGLMTSSYSWRYTFEELGKHYTCYAPDLPGAGRTPAALRTSYGPQHLARWLAALQRALGIRGCDVIGNSLGGYLCMHLALQDPESIHRLVNLHAPGVLEPRIILLNGILQLPGTKRLLRALVHRDPLRWVHRNVHYYDESYKSLEEAHEYGAPLATDDGCDAFHKYLGETMDPRPMRVFHAELKARRRAHSDFPVPLLLLYAEKDPMVPPRFGHVYAKQIPDAELVWLSQASHFAHVDATARFLGPVLRFFGHDAS